MNRQAVEDWTPIVRQMLYRYGRPGPQVDSDVIEAAGWEAVWRALDSYDSDLGELAGWIAYKVRYAMIDELRRQTSWRTELGRPTILWTGEEWDSRQPVDPSDPIGELDSDLTRRSTLARLLSLFYLLTPRLRLILCLHYLEGVALKKIGDALGVTESRICQLAREACEELQLLAAGLGVDAA